MKNKLFLATLVSYLGIYVTMPILSAISTKAHMIPSQIGVMISCGAFAMLLFAPVWGKISDKLGRRMVIVTGLLGMSIFFILYVFLFHLSISTGKAANVLVYSLMGTRFLLGMFMTTTPTAASAYMADISSPQDRSKDMASLGFATGLAMVLGPIIGGAVSTIGNLYTPFYLTIIGLLIFSLVMVAVLPRQQKIKSPEKTLTNTLQQTKSKRNFFSLELAGWLLAGCAVMLVVVVLQLITSLYLHDIFKQTVTRSAQTAALLFFVLGIALMLVQVLQMKVLQWTAKMMMMVGIPLIIVGLLLATITSAYYLIFVSYILIGAGAGLGMSSLSAGCSLAVSESQQGAVAGTVAMIQGIAGIVSPLLGSFVYQLNPKFPFFLFGGFACLAYLFFLMVTKQKKNLIG
ncbi:MFS transporter [Liquorilactobacillus mali]|nr:MFS transporter [Liquorilactobacillus mali]EJE99699.1 major facilitator superfamily permease [Liquorilactobacillus mali KCTC 3596 = DSM 20444]QFQ73881.1 MFS transporter [Liquorilactobacillus mali]